MSVCLGEVTIWVILIAMIRGELTKGTHLNEKEKSRKGKKEKRKNREAECQKLSEKESFSPWRCFWSSQLSGVGRRALYWHLLSRGKHCTNHRTASHNRESVCPECQ